MFFYSDKGILDSPRPGRLQAALDVLTVLFDRFVLHINTNNTVGIVWQPCCMDGGHSEGAYKRRITGVGTSFRERQQEQVKCPECASDLLLVSLVAHLHNQHGVSWSTHWDITPPPLPRSRIYRAYFPRAYKI